MTNVLTLKITYAGCENKIWREAQISENAALCDLGYMILASFGTLANHLFEISYGDLTFELPDEDGELEWIYCLFCINLKNLQLEPGAKLRMIYDFGCEQVFDIEVTAVEPMKKGAGRAYPKIINGAGRGILDDVPAFKTLEIIKKTDRNGKSNHRYMCDGAEEMIWDYRDYDAQADNVLLKGRIEEIADGYSYFAEFINWDSDI